MRIFALALSLFLVGCASVSKDKPNLPMPTLSSKSLAPGECGLYVWTADASKTFTLFASPSEISLFQNKVEFALTEKNPVSPPPPNREFRDRAGKAYSLSLLSPQEIEGGIRYKAGRLTSITEDGWEKLVPIVGLYACQPIA